MNVLIIADDDLLGYAIYSGLAQYGYNVFWETSYLSALSTLKEKSCDMILLDYRLFEFSGEQLFKNTRFKNVYIPVIVIAGSNNVCDRIKWLNMGADDYVSALFDFDELCARIRAVYRRTSNRVSPIITVGHITLDPNTWSVFCCGKKIKLSRHEFVLLRLCMENVGKVIPRERMLQYIYNWDDTINSNTLEVYVHNLRKKLGCNIIIACCNEGYLFTGVVVCSNDIKTVKCQGNLKIVDKYKYSGR